MNNVKFMGDLLWAKVLPQGPGDLIRLEGNSHAVHTKEKNSIANQLSKKLEIHSCLLAINEKGPRISEQGMKKQLFLL